MAVERVGYRRLYDAVGCSLEGSSDFSCSFDLVDIRVDLYIGPKPRLGFHLVTSDKYVFPGSTGLIGNVEYNADASQSSYPRSCFLEIVCSSQEEVDERVSNSFRIPQESDYPAMVELALAREKEYKAAADLVAGIIGLRFHIQFVIEKLHEESVAFADTGPVLHSAGPAVMVLNPVQLLEAGAARIRDLFTALASADAKQIWRASGVLGWLLRAWAERDPVSQFVALFIPVEMILKGVSSGPPPVHHEVEILNELISEHGGSQKSQLSGFLYKLVAAYDRPSLKDRFAIFARQASLPGAETDIAAFNKFTKIRNDLVHQGDPSVQITVSVTETDVRQLADIAERYVSLALFRDANVYGGERHNTPTHEST